MERPAGLTPLAKTTSPFGLIKDGHSLAFVQKALGHSRPEVTARYAHLKDEATRAAFDHVGAVYTRRRETGQSAES